ncbi:ABC transporter ATP-binding protein [Williamsia sterculiae]|uniref:ATP-binding cassette, subfamily B n=1 Tax=Williamsia sterculiae TaxID=1344003 RepID=A0A1N7HA34_9NOCA|nr:ABC transporter ATP-binding protein [Williamsia sterculiae]SIS21739.1 ATP-binding cassette, subfamily B [Williamsia sterculiae]
MTVRDAARRFAPLVVHHRRRYALAAIFLVVSAVAEIIGIFVLSDVLDMALSSDSWQTFAATAAAWLALTLVGAVTDYFGQLRAIAASEDVVRNLRNHLFAWVQRLHPRLHRSYGLGDLVNRHLSDLEAIEHLTGSGLMQLLIATLSTVGLVTAAFIMSWQVAVVAVIAIPVMWLISRSFATAQTRATRLERAANSNIGVAVHEGLAGHETAVAYNQQSCEHARVAGFGQDWLRARIFQSRVEVGFGSVMSVGQVLLTLIIAVMGVWQIRQGHLSVGGLVALTGYLGYLYPKMQEIADLRLSVSSAVVSAERVAELLDLPPSDTDQADAISPSVSPHSTLSLRGVGYGYGPESLLDNASLDVRPGELTALVGPSGSGKSTLAGLLVRFDTPQRGSILLDGTDIRTMTAASVREHVTLLPQQTTIKAGTVADNIAYAQPGATESQVVAAAVAADADDFIRALPLGYATVLDEEGLALSGGQRQRIALARAILRDTPILVLDEPTSGLDTATAARVVEALRRLAVDRTVLVITHDPRLAAAADNVVELRGRRLVHVRTPRHAAPGSMRMRLDVAPRHVVRSLTT